ncbi:hypothetical protein [Belnapia rosea]|uniref:Uncharacterized protein n=2 Tax=Belnapia rosea TaxID=938405 RepID=A0A1G6J3Z8_9PROT|nr:hypothetical protein [Belnapia rosea]SDB09534.1 hypothetical protein SAMN02927895_00228 [Belnapia rosea]SDC12985.1 hypothetical protein SAMN04487779_100141 [Belnapia rosea]
MTSETFILLSGSLTFGVPIVLAIRELRGLRRGGGGHSEPAAPRPAPRPRGGSGRPLPDCLIPKPRPARPPRVRELA